ncbi:DUF2630 family protein [Brevibacterium sp. 91QC2O2]|jgi:hypothetical protein|uniref:DUF2630 family protein n=1 Tax=Brevibacterium TaxID=1696 RepID=UPI00211C2545|nr:MULTISPECIES: DUF2630 family protein [unclassified Brevibacterium]MCQ9368382.1 DUF2630 family protein [Brevibacterium sp. 91QC2O2]MCQ9384710.1 DUF2630 family protein [Brevibacterium sp. 68QC2CO]
MNESSIHDDISQLVEREHELRAELQRKEISSQEEMQELKGIEVQLDRCWDLLRRRQALRAAGENPDLARERPADQVEGYLD